MRISILVVAVFALVLTACAPPTPGIFYPTLAATPALDPGTGFVTGENLVPAAKYPFVELWNNTVGYSRVGECKGASMIDYPTYSFSDRRLELDTGLASLDANRAIIGFFGLENTNGGAMGGGVDSSLSAIQQLPFVLPGNKSIQSILEDGTLALQVADGQMYWLRPGQVWIAHSEYEPDPDCHVIVTSRLTNFGLLEEENIDLAGTPLAPSKTPGP
jgi:hypothetical protein